MKLATKIRPRKKAPPGTRVAVNVSALEREVARLQEALRDVSAGAENQRRERRKAQAAADDALDRLSKCQDDLAELRAKYVPACALAMSAGYLYRLLDDMPFKDTKSMQIEHFEASCGFVVTDIVEVDPSVKDDAGHGVVRLRTREASDERDREASR